MALAGPGATSPTVGTLATDGKSVVSYSGYLNGESFQQEGITSYNGWQYTAYWNSAGNAVIARRQLPSGSWQKVVLTDYTSTSTDSHNVICLGICRGDGSIHLSFDLHDSTLEYRKSVTGLATSPSSFSWTPSQFGAVQNQLYGTVLTGVTYPAFINAPGGKLQLALRIGASGSGDEYLYEYSNGTWTSLGKFIDGISSSVNAYLFGIEYDRFGRLHTTWTWRDTPNGSSNHDLMYAYSDDQGRTWKNNAGTTIAASGASFITPASSGIKVWTIPQNRGLMNQESQVVDGNGIVHVIASHLPDSAPNNSDFNSARLSVVLHHYFQNTNGTWARQATPFTEGLSRSDVGVDSQNNLYVITGNSSTYKLHVESASAASGWSDWTLDYTSSGIYFSDPLLDHQRLLTDGKLSVFSPRVKSGTIDILDFGAGGPVPSGTYSLRNRSSGKMLDNLGSTANGARVGQWTDGTSDNQKWMLTYTTGVAHLMCVTGNQCLDSLGHVGNGSTVGQWAANPSPNQQWTIQDIGAGYYKVINRANGLCLDTGGISTNGSTMQFWASGGSYNQQWQFMAP
ncbi:MAG TPA: BNR-4 repeat-containing protein [Candidatus Paceibacterota bacterium]|nr:BNR-4 repeat-containing protein [Candidatus Paceibacterota bacterium]